MDAATWLADRAFGKAVAQVETKSLKVDMGLININLKFYTLIEISVENVQVMWLLHTNI